MGFESIYNQYRGELRYVEQHLRDFTESITEENSRQLVQYFLEKKGHRLRPILSFIAFECAGGNLKDKQVLFKRAATLELLHSASLLHDDVIDQEEIRRGQPAINSIKGNKTAVLVGNLFYLNAFRLVVDPENMKYYEAMLKTSLCMCQGEILQSEKIDESLSLEEYLEIIENKTAKLIELSCFFGATTAETDEENIKKISKIGSIIGLFYQIRDDKKDSDVHLKNEKALELICEKMHQDFLMLVKELEEGSGLNMNKFIEIEQLVRP